MNEARPPLSIPVRRSSRWAAVPLAAILVAASLVMGIGPASASITIRSLGNWWVGETLGGRPSINTQPDAAFSDGTRVWLANFEEGKGLTIVDAATGSVIEQRPIAGQHQIIFGNSSYVFLPAGPFQGSSIEWYDRSTTLSAGSVSFTGASGWTTGYISAATADDTYVWAVNHSSGQLARRKISDPADVNPNFATISQTAGGQTVALASDGTWLWAADLAGGKVTRVSVADGSQTTFTLPSGTYPRDIAIDGSHIWIAASSSPGPDLLELQASDGSIVASTNLRSGLYSVRVGSGQLWVANLSGIAKVDPATFEISNVVAVSDLHGIAWDGTYAWASQMTGSRLWKIGPALAPGAPTGVQGTAGRGESRIQWTAPTDDGGSPITGYEVRYSSDGGRTWTTATMCTGTGTSCTVTGLTDGATYVFDVAAINGAGTGASSASSPDVVLPSAPDAPTNVGGTAGNTRADVEWTAPATDGGSAITGYSVEQSDDGGATWTPVSTCASIALTCTVTGLTNGTGYVFRVSATNVVGTSSWSDPSATLTPAGGSDSGSGGSGGSGGSTSGSTSGSSSVAPVFTG